MSDNDIPHGNGYVFDKRWIEATLGDHTDRLERIEAALHAKDSGSVSKMWAVIMSLVGAILTAGVMRAIPHESPQVEALTRAISGLEERVGALQHAEDRR